MLLNNMIIQQTWEGDNNVLLQQTGKYLLDIFKNKMKGKQMKATTTCEWVKTDPVLGQKCPAQTLEELVSFDTLVATFEFRANFLLQKTAMELSNRVMGDSKEHPLDAWNAVQPFYIQDLACAYGDLLLVRYTCERLRALNEGKTDAGVNSDTKEILNLLLKLDALTRMFKGMSVWLEAEYLDGSHVQIIREGIMKTNEAIKKHAVAYTYSILYDEELIDSMLAPSDGELYKSIVQRVQSSPNAFSRISNWKELYE